MAGHEAIATGVLLGPRVSAHAQALLAAPRPPPAPGAPLVVAVSPLGDGVLVRIAGHAVEAVTNQLRRLLGPAASALGEDPWSRRW
jgi:urease accessory protein